MESEQTQQSAPATSAPATQPSAGNPQPSAADTAKTTAVLAWIFAPFTSFVWKDDANPLIKTHAQESLYIGIAQVVVIIAMYILQWILSALFWSSIGFATFGLASLTAMLMQLLWLGVAAFIVVPRIMGIVHANNGQEWHLPQVTNFVKKYVKL